MHKYQPALKVEKASPNVRSFVRDGQSEFFTLIRRYAPALLLLFVIQILVLMFHLEILSSLPVPLFFVGIVGNIVIPVLDGYIYAIIAINWHRLVINGRCFSEPVRMFLPRRNEISFVLALVFLTILPYILVFSFGLIVSILAPVLSSTGDLGSSFSVIVLVVYIFVGGIGVLYFTYKLSFYFPAKAVNHSFSVVDSVRLTRGYFFKMIFTMIRASFWTIVALLVYLGFMSLLMYLLSYVVGGMAVEASASDDFNALSLLPLFGALFQLPFVLFFKPMFMIIGVTVVSNYYLYAIQNEEGAVEE